MAHTLTPALAVIRPINNALTVTRAITSALTDMAGPRTCLVPAIRAPAAIQA
jgi:hypothetical protein